MKPFSVAAIAIFLVGANALAKESAKPKQPIPVKVVFLEALSTSDTTASETFRKEFQSTIQLGSALTKAKLAKCGYELDPIFTAFNANDQLQAFEMAKQAEAQNAWMIVGPRRSNHFLLVAKGAPTTPSVSIMASSSEVQVLGDRFLSLYPFNPELADAAAKIGKELHSDKGKSSTYLSIVSEDCLSCRDFSSQFDRAAGKMGLKKVGQINVIGDNPPTEGAVAAVLSSRPKLVLLPNYSKVSALLMGAINEKDPTIRFIGGDGWGDQKFGFVERNPAIRDAPGVTVRGFPPAEEGLKAFPLGREALNGKAQGKFVPSSGPGLAILKIIEGLTDGLCQTKSSDKAAFLASFEKSGRKWFKSPWGVSAYEVKDGTVSYLKRVK